MSVTLIGFAVILLFTVIGYFRGILRILVAFASLLLAAILARPLSFMCGWAAERADFVPKTLAPLAAVFATGFLFFLICIVAGEVYLRRREERRDWEGLPAKERWERLGGAVAGGVWGFVLVLITLIGLEIVGNVEEIALKAVAGPAQPTDAAQPPPAPEGEFITLRKEIELSPFGLFVEQANPVDDRVLKTFEDLMYVAGDPDLFEQFRNHPVISHFADDPRIIAVAEDPEIQQQVQAKQFFELLDNEKIAALLKEDDLFDELKRVDLGAILREIIEGSKFEVSSSKFPDGEWLRLQVHGA